LTHLFREKGLTAVKFLNKVIFNKKNVRGPNYDAWWAACGPLARRCLGLL